MYFHKQFVILFSVLNFVTHKFNLMTTSMIFAIALFTIMNIVGLIMFAAFTFNPGFALKFSSSPSGVDLSSLSAHDKDVEKALKYFVGFSASQILGTNVLSLLIVWFPFRNGECWAWCAMLYFPVMFVWHYIHYDKKSPTIKVQIVWLVLSIAALALSYKDFSIDMSIL